MNNINNFDTMNNTIHQLYGKYINDPQYVYKSCGDYVVIMRLLEDTKTNLNRNDITDPTNAKYRADKIYTELIFNKYDPNKTILSISNTFYKSKVTYTVNSITYPDKFDNDLNKFYTNGIHFFKSIEQALLWDLNLIDCSYTGRYIRYYECGKIYSICNYTDGKKCGDFIRYNRNGTVDEKRNYINNKQMYGEIFMYDYYGSIDYCSSITFKKWIYCNNKKSNVKTCNNFFKENIKCNLL